MHEVFDYKLATDTTPEGETIVQVIHKCGSESDIWAIVSCLWVAALLLYSVILAFLASRAKEDINESRTQTILSLVQFVFSFLRLSTILLSDSLDPFNEMAYESLLHSAECLMALFLFVLPKLFSESDERDSNEALPELFLRTSIIFVDIVGFTAWSSVREPTQVFKFLDSLFAAFDDLADKRNVLKIETVGDVYGKFHKVIAICLVTKLKMHALANSCCYGCSSRSLRPCRPCFSVCQGLLVTDAASGKGKGSRVWSGHKQSITPNRYP